MRQTTLSGIVRGLSRGSQKVEEYLEKHQEMSDYLFFQLTTNIIQTFQSSGTLVFLFKHLFIFFYSSLILLSIFSCLCAKIYDFFVYMLYSVFTMNSDLVKSLQFEGSQPHVRMVKVKQFTKVVFSHSFRSQNLSL
jgi:hypothetical protein